MNSKGPGKSKAGRARASLRVTSLAISYRAYGERLKRLQRRDRGLNQAFKKREMELSFGGKPTTHRVYEEKQDSCLLRRRGEMEGRREETASTSWKLYDNPFYEERRRRRHRRRSGGDEAAAAELRRARAQIEEMKAELEMERALRKRAEELLERTAEISRRKEEAAAAITPWGLRRSPCQKRESPENPHIKRAMKGYVEFPRGLRGRSSSSPCSRNGEEGGAARVDCQLAQLRVLLKGRAPPGSAPSRLDPLLA
ncbi:uncharacterized protein LOC144716371 [Wolffia australiana]